MTRDWHIRDVYAQYLQGQITFDDVIAAAERGIAEHQQRRQGEGKGPGPPAALPPAPAQPHQPQP